MTAVWKGVLHITQATVLLAVTGFSICPPSPHPPNPWKRFETSLHGLFRSVLNMSSRSRVFKTLLENLPLPYITGSGSFPGGPALPRERAPGTGASKHRARDQAESGRPVAGDRELCRPGSAHLFSFSGATTRPSTPAAASTTNGQYHEKNKHAGLWAPPRAALGTTTEGVLRHSAISLALPTARNEHKKDDRSVSWGSHILRCSIVGRQCPMKTTRRERNRTSAMGCPPPPSAIYVSSNTLQRQYPHMAGARLQSMGCISAAAMFWNPPNSPMPSPGSLAPWYPAQEMRLKGHWGSMRSCVLLQVPESGLLLATERTWEMSAGLMEVCAHHLDLTS